MTIPCKDCITLSACMAQYKRIPHLKLQSAYTLYLKCSILSSYLNNRGLNKGILNEGYTNKSYTTLLDRVINFYSYNKGVI